jgi:hypothetical protein
MYMSPLTGLGVGQNTGAINISPLRGFANKFLVTKLS